MACTRPSIVFNYHSDYGPLIEGFGCAPEDGPICKLPHIQ